MDHWIPAFAGMTIFRYSQVPFQIRSMVAPLIELNETEPS